MNSLSAFSTNRTRDEWFHLLIVFIILMVTYLWSMPRTVVLEDDGYFILAAYYNGIAHPPGYPLYTIFGHLSTWLPIGSIAFRVHALSALFGSLSCCCLWWITRMIINERIYAYIAAFSFGFSKVFWSQSIIAEVYTLNVLLFLLLVILIFYWVEFYKEEYSRWLLRGMAVIYGLSISNHWPLLAISTPMLLALIWEKKREFLCQLPRIFPWIFLGLSPYLWMVIRSQMDPVISFYGPIESWSDFWFYISRQGYEDIEFSPSAGWWDKLQFTGFVSSESLHQFGIISIFFVFIGFVKQWSIWSKSLCSGLVLGVLGNTLLLIWLLDFDYDLLHRNIFRVYPLIAYAIFALWLALGVFCISQIISRLKKIVIYKELIVRGFAIVVIGTILLGNIADNYRANDTWAKDYAQKVLGSLEQNAILFISGDLDMSPISYVNLVEKVRPDITLYSVKGILLSNRLFYPNKNSNEERHRLIDEFITTTQKPIYYIYGLPHNYGVQDFGLYWKIDKNLIKGFHNAIAIPEITDYFQRISSRGEPVDPWEAMHYRVLITGHCRLSLNLMNYYDNETESTNQFKPWVNKFCQTFHGKLAHIEILLNKNQPDWNNIKLLLSEAKKISDQSVLKSDPAKLQYLQGEFLRRTGNLNDAIESYQRSINIWQHPDNPSFKKIKEISK